MAKSTSKPPRKPTPIDASTPFDEPVNDMNAAEALEPEQIPQERPSTPKNGPTTKTPTFIQTMNSVPKGDWGLRANIYLYRVEPVIDRTRSGDSKFINVYAEPLSEDRVMADYGSGRYKLILNFRKPGAETGDVIDSMYMDILNMKYPPKIPLGEWTDDPRNKKWAWAKEANGIPAATAAQPATAVETFVDVLRATGDIRREIREEMQDNAPSQQAPMPVDPWSAAEKILNMRSENPMVAILQQQMKDAAAATEAERDRAFKAAESAREREFKLQEKLLEAKTAAPAEKPKTFMEQMTEFKTLKDLFTSATTGEAIVRTGRVTGLEVARDIAGKLLDSDLASGIGQWLAAKAQQSVNPATPGMNGPPAQNGVQQPAPQDFNAFLRDVLNPALMRHYAQGFTGSEFAGWLYDGYPDRLKELQNFTHPLMPGQRGAPVIVAGYKRTAHMWPTLSIRGEQAFVDFVNEFCAWKPDSQASDTTDAEVDDGQPIDLDEPEEGRAS